VSGGEVLDLAGAAVGQHQAVDGQRAAVAAVNRRRLQLKLGAVGRGHQGAGAGAVNLDVAAGRGGALVVLERVARQRQLGAGAVDLKLAVIGEVSGGEVLDLAGAAVGQHQAVDGQRAAVAAVNRRRLQLKLGAVGRGHQGAGAGAVNLDVAAGRGGALVVLERVARQRQLGAGAVDLKLAVIGEVSGGEVLDLAGAAVGQHQAVDGQRAAVAAVNRRRLQLKLG